MAKSSDELERELDARRQQLLTRVHKLRERVAGDLRGMRDETREEVEAYKHKAEAYLQKAEAKAGEHPWLTLAGGFGSGVALGMAGPSLSEIRGHRAGSGNGASHNAQGESLLSRGFGTLVSMAGGPVVNEVREQLQGPLDELRSSVQDSVRDVVHGITGSKNGPNANGAEHRQKVRDHVAA